MTQCVILEWSKVSWTILCSFYHFPGFPGKYQPPAGRKVFNMSVSISYIIQNHFRRRLRWNIFHFDSRDWKVSWICNPRLLLMIPEICRIESWWKLKFICLLFLVHIIICLFCCLNCYLSYLCLFLLSNDILHIYHFFPWFFQEICRKSQILFLAPNE